MISQGKEKGTYTATVYNTEIAFCGIYKYIYIERFLYIANLACMATASNCVGTESTML